MELRMVTQSDLQQIDEIHKKWYADEFVFPDLTKFMYLAVAIEREKVICASGLKPIAEAIYITNKDESLRARREALIQSFELSKWMAGNAHVDQIHAFIQELKWENQLKKHGFEPIRGVGLVYNVTQP